MTVKELIEKLSAFNPDAEVSVETDLDDVIDGDITVEVNQAEHGGVILDLTCTTIS